MQREGGSVLVGVIGVVFALLGAVFVGAGVRQGSQRRRQVASWPRVEGVVIGDSLPNVATTTAVVEFTTLDGRVIRASTESGAQAGFDKSGARVPVWYDPADPHRIHANVHRGDASALPTVIVGLVLTVAGVLAAVLFL